MKSILIIFFLAGALPHITAQIVFSKNYDLEEHMDNAATVVPFDNHLISVGLADNFLVGNNMVVTGFGVLKTDLEGNEIWKFNIDGIERIRLNVVTYDQNFVYALVRDFRSGMLEEKIIRISSDGSYDFFEPFQTFGLFLENPTIWHLFKTPTGFIAGITENLEDPIGKRQSVIEYDENFVPQSWIVYKQPSEVFRSRRIISNPTGGYVISGDNIVLGEFIQVVKKIDEAGNTEWTYELPYSNEFFIESPVLVNQAGEILVAYIQDFVNPATGMLENPTMLTKLSSDGDVLWETNLSEERSTLMNNMFFTENEDIVLVGKSWHLPVNDLLGRTVRVDQDGNIIWERTYSDERNGGINFSELNNGFEMDNGDLVFAGTTIDTVNNVPLAHQDFWLLRVGSDGCYIPDCDFLNIITPVNDLDPFVENVYFLSPTIATENVKIQPREESSTSSPLSISVFNISGQEMDKKQNRSLPYDLDVIHYPSGFYFVTLTNNTGQIQTLKFVKP
jgi:hypothetical protein